LTQQVQKQIKDAGFYVDADLTDRKIDKKVNDFGSCSKFCSVVGW